MPMILSLLALSLGVRQVALPPAPGPLDNPMKGFASYCDPGNVLSSPDEMAFEEIGWDTIEPTEGRYAFDRWEQTLWDAVPAKGKHVVIRIYLDYPSKPCAVPKWLIAKGVKMTQYDEFGGGLSPDYENPELRKSLLKLIAAMGARYDRDPRVDFVQVGLLGHWGEWHDYPHSEMFASPAVQKEVIGAMHKAFPDKPLMARNASYASCQLPWLGFHDDMIPSDTFGKDDWEFIPALEKGGVAGNWKVAPTGGEMVPGAAKQYVGKDWDLLIKSVKDAHFTWIGPYCPAMASDLTPEEHARVEQLIRTLGYEFQLTGVKIPTEVASGGPLAITVEGKNQGVAPFYQPWNVQLALIDDRGKPTQVWNLADVRKWLPGDFSESLVAKAQVAPGRYRVAIGIIDPATKLPGIKFANQLDQASGYTLLTTLQVSKPLTQ